MASSCVQDVFLGQQGIKINYFRARKAEGLRFGWNLSLKCLQPEKISKAIKFKTSKIKTLERY